MVPHGPFRGKRPDPGLPFPLPPALDQSSRRILQTSFSTPYRTSTSLNLTPLNLTHFLSLRSLHFGASWPLQIDPRSAQVVSSSFIFQKRKFSRNIGMRSVWGLSRVPKTTQDGAPKVPRRTKITPQRGLENKTLSEEPNMPAHLWSRCVKGPIWDPSWGRSWAPKSIKSAPRSYSTSKKC